MSKFQLEFGCCQQCQTEFILDPSLVKTQYDNTYYDSWGKSDELEETVKIKQRTAEFLLNQLKLKEGSSIFELGCAKGDFLEVAYRRGFKVTGMDINAYAIEEAKKKYPHLNLSCSDLLATPITEHSFDAAVLIDVIEHVSNPTSVLEKVGKLLKPGGMLLLVTPDVGGKLRTVLRKHWPHYKEEHLVYFSDKSIRMLLRNCAFEAAIIRPAVKFLTLRYLQRQFETYRDSILSGFARNLLKLTKQLPIYRKPLGMQDGTMLVIAKKL